MSRTTSWVSMRYQIWYDEIGEPIQETHTPPRVTLRLGHPHPHETHLRERVKSGNQRPHVKGGLPGKQDIGSNEANNQNDLNDPNNLNDQ